MSDKLTLKKGDDVKYLDADSKLVKLLKEDGWKVEGEEKRKKPKKKDKLDGDSE